MGWLYCKLWKERRENMENMFQKNLKELAIQYSQKVIAEKTGFSQSSINNYLSHLKMPLE